MLNKIKEIVEDSIQVKNLMAKDHKLLSIIEQISQACIHCFQKGGKILFCGNGGSAADAQHLAAEFSGRFYKDRQPLFAEALHVNTSYLTAVANDYSYEDIYSRLIIAKGQPKDILFAISTSGNSANILKACMQAQNQGMITVGFTGKSGGQMKKHCNLLLAIPSDDTPRIQEAHILAGHIICQLTEEQLYP